MKVILLLLAVMSSDGSTHQQEIDVDDIDACLKLASMFIHQDLMDFQIDGMRGAKQLGTACFVVDDHDPA